MRFNNSFRKKNHLVCLNLEKELIILQMINFIFLSMPSSSFSYPLHERIHSPHTHTTYIKFLHASISLFKVLCEKTVSLQIWFILLINILTLTISKIGLKLESIKRKFLRIKITRWKHSLKVYTSIFPVIMH